MWNKKAQRGIKTRYVTSEEMERVMKVLAEKENSQLTEEKNNQRYQKLCFYL
ncbi:putative integrase [Orientia tsutsugamushi str. TA763]|nr:putative integrase [Orientia tsutsugamushi str. TA763]